MMHITIEVIPHVEQRYNTVGDWQWLSEDNLKITVSKMDNWKKEFAVAFHELIEVMLCRDRGIQQELVDRFDIEYEEQRLPYDHESEPGDSPGAPYKREHFFATSLERLLCSELGLDWGEYEKTICSL